MADSKWRLFEYEYSIVEFILGFVIVFFVVYFFLSSLRSAPSLYGILEASAGVALLVGAIWTYLRARELFEEDIKKKG